MNFHVLINHSLDEGGISVRELRAISWMKTIDRSLRGDLFQIGSPTRMEVRLRWMDRRRTVFFRLSRPVIWFVCTQSSYAEIEWETRGRRGLTSSSSMDLKKPTSKARNWVLIELVPKLSGLPIIFNRETERWQFVRRGKDEHCLRTGNILVHTWRGIENRVHDSDLWRDHLCLNQARSIFQQTRERARSSAHGYLSTKHGFASKATHGYPLSRTYLLLLGVALYLPQGGSGSLMRRVMACICSGLMTNGFLPGVERIRSPFKNKFSAKVRTMPWTS